MNGLRVLSINISRAESSQIAAFEAEVLAVCKDNPSARVQWIQTASGAGAGTGAAHSHAVAYGHHQLTAIITW